MTIEVPFHGGKLDGKTIALHIELDDAPYGIYLDEDEENGRYFRVEDPSGRIHYIHKDIVNIFEWKGQ